MCSSGAVDVLNPVTFVKKANKERNRVARDLKAPFVTPDAPDAQKPSVAGSGTRLAIGTQVGGKPRKPLGSTEPTSGLNI